VSADPQVAAVVVSWNGGSDLVAALDSLGRQSLPPAEVVVVDNGSVDGSAEWVAGLPGVRLVRNPRNLGFAVAANQGIAATSSELVLLLNQDVVLDPEFLEMAAHRMTIRPEAGTVASRLRRGAVLDSTGHLLHSSLWVSNRGQGEPDDGRYAEAEEVFGASAAAVLYRRAMLQDVALEGEVFCARYFAYLEDVDLDFRARWRGWSCWYEPQASGSHLRGGSGLHRTAAIERHVLTNRFLLLERVAPPSWRRGVGQLRPRALLLLRCGLAVRRHPAAVLGVMDAARQLGAARREWRLIWDARRVEEGEILRWAAPTPWRRLLRRSN
jgi:GT2 family glycosyltransferase